MFPFVVYIGHRSHPGIGRLVTEHDVVQRLARRSIIDQCSQILLAHESSAFRHIKDAFLHPVCDLIVLIVRDVQGEKVCFGIIFFKECFKFRHRFCCRPNRKSRIQKYGKDHEKQGRSHEKT